MSFHLFETRINIYDFFTFELSASALGMDADIVVEISVEYSELQEDPNMVGAFVWARKAGASIKGMVHALRVPKHHNRDAQNEAIVEMLNQSDDFQKTLCEFIAKFAL